MAPMPLAMPSSASCDRETPGGGSSGAIISSHLDFMRPRSSQESLLLNGILGQQGRRRFLQRAATGLAACRAGSSSLPICEQRQRRARRKRATMMARPLPNGRGGPGGASNSDPGPLTLAGGRANGRVSASPVPRAPLCRGIDAKFPERVAVRGTACCSIEAHIAP
jgi:hypothetical protein